MVKPTIGILNQSQDKINRQFYKMLMEAEAGDASAIQALVDKIGDESTANTILKRLKDLETETTSLETVIGDESTANTILYRIKQLETTVTTVTSAIGDESTEGTILARIKALEDAP